MPTPEELSRQYFASKHEKSVLYKKLLAKEISVYDAQCDMEQPFDSVPINENHIAVTYRDTRINKYEHQLIGRYGEADEVCEHIVDKITKLIIAHYQTRDIRKVNNMIKSVRNLLEDGQIISYKKHGNHIAMNWEIENG